MLLVQLGTLVTEMSSVSTLVACTNIVDWSRVQGGAGRASWAGWMDLNDLAAVGSRVTIAIAVGT